jgi:hypothetical protein
MRVRASYERSRGDDTRAGGRGVNNEDTGASASDDDTVGEA